MLEVSGIGVLAAFAAGAVSFLAPCVLPLVPGYVSYVAGQAATDKATPGSDAPTWPRVPVLIGLVLVGLGLWSLWFGVFHAPRPS